MAPKNQGIRVTVVVEDQRLERFCREVLIKLGFNSREIRVEKSPAGRGSGKQWVDNAMAKEVKILRSKNYQSLAVVVGSDVDELSLDARVDQLGSALKSAGLSDRSVDEKVVYWLPKWSIETWLLYLAGDTVDENVQHKNRVGEPDFRRIAETFIERKPPPRVRQCGLRFVKPNSG